MTTRTKRAEAIALAILIAGGVGYATAQQQPAQPKAQQQPAAPKAQQQPVQNMRGTDMGNACSQGCDCMKHGAEGGQNGMMGGQQNGMMGGQQNGMMGGQQNGMMGGQRNGMMGGQRNGMMGGQGMMGGMDGASCSMADMRAMADVKIENTKSGAIIRMSAKKAEQVAQIQQMAQRMTQCMGNAEPAGSSPAAPATPSRAR